MTCFIPLAYVSYYGINTWFFEKFQASRTAEERLFGPVSENVRKIGEVQIAFQAWDLAISLFNSELNSLELLLHHADWFVVLLDVEFTIHVILWDIFYGCLRNILVAVSGRRFHAFLSRL